MTKGNLECHCKFIVVLRYCIAAESARIWRYGSSAYHHQTR